jgi:hypothetical protein
MNRTLILIVCFLLAFGGVQSLMGLPIALKGIGSSVRHASLLSSPSVERSLTKGPSSNALPWSQSITPQRDLSYMPIFEMQLDVILAMEMEKVPLQSEFVYRTSTVKPARIGNMCFKNDKFRKVRMTYFDAGDNVQVG